MEVGRSIQRVDAVDKVTGRAQYTDDLCPRNALVAKVLHSTIANGWVKSMDTAAAEALPGVVKVLTCFDVPEIQYPTPGHPWSVPTRTWPTGNCSTGGCASMETISPPWWRWMRSPPGGRWNGSG